MEAIEMRTHYKIFASGALKKFLDARASGASREILMKLSEEAQEEQRTAAKPAAPRLSLVSHNPDVES